MLHNNSQAISSRKEWLCQPTYIERRGSKNCHQHPSFIKVFAMKKIITFSLALCVILTLSSVVYAATAAKNFSRGNALLARSDFQGALTLFADALKAEPANQEYAQEFSMLRQVIAWQNYIEKTDDIIQWTYGCNVIRAYCVSHRLHQATLDLDRMVFDRLKNPEAAVKLAQTELSLGKAEEAVKTLSSLDTDKATVATRSLLGVALARSGKEEDAKKLATEIGVPEDAGSGTLYSIARLQSVVGNEQLACHALVNCFESIPPSRLEAFKKHAEKCSDFQTIAKGELFETALKTKSKIPESQCSGGSSCATCPNRGSCPGSR